MRLSGPGTFKLTFRPKIIRAEKGIGVSLREIQLIPVYNAADARSDKDNSDFSREARSACGAPARMKMVFVGPGHHARPNLRDKYCVPGLLQLHLQVLRTWYPFLHRVRRHARAGHSINSRSIPVRNRFFTNTGALSWFHCRIGGQSTRIRAPHGDSVGAGGLL